jgi:NAD(P)-dependent dehydrogenase (short-subunit alcohol dehydrogenase family)
MRRSGHAPAEANTVSGLFDLGGRVVVVTGGLGRLGQAFCEALTRHNARVAILDRSPDPVRAAAAITAGGGPKSTLLIEADVTSRASLEAALAEIERRWETPAGLVNNAALDSPPDARADENGPYETYPDDSFDRVMEVNVKGVHLCCQVFGGAMARAGRGSIVNIGSIYGAVSPDQALYEYRRHGGDTFFKPVAYSVSKSALYNLTRYLAVYWGSAGVRTNTVTFAGVFDNQDARFLERYLKKVPLGRMASPSDYVGTIIYLLSDASAYATGADFVIDGGFTAM